MSITIKFYNKKYWCSSSLITDGKIPLEDSPAQRWQFERPDQISPEGGQHDDEAHLHHGGPAGQTQPQRDHGAPGGVGAADSSEYLGEDDIIGQEHRDHHGHSQEDVGPQRLGSLAHELFVIETEQQQAGEEGEKATVEDLGHENDVSPISWKINFVKTNEKNQQVQPHH